MIVKGPGRTGHWTVALLSAASSQRSNLKGRKEKRREGGREGELESFVGLRRRGERWFVPPLDELDETEFDEDVGVRSLLFVKSVRDQGTSTIERGEREGGGDLCMRS